MRPAPGAMIRIERTAFYGKLRITPTGGATRESTGASYTRVPWKVIPGTALEGAFATTSDAQGRFAFDALPRWRMYSTFRKSSRTVQSPAVRTVADLVDSPLAQPIE